MPLTSWVTAPPPSSRRTDSTSSPRRRTSPMPRRWYWSASTSSSSTNSSSRARFSTSVTCTPSAAAIEAYSRPITPPPITVIVAGRRRSRRMPSESSTVRSSNSTPAGRAGVVPTAITKRSAESERSPTRSVCGSTKDAVPVSTSTWLRRNWSKITSRSCSITCWARQTRSSSSTVCLGRQPVSRTIAARSVFEGTVPVFVEAPPSTFARSITAARLPSFEACTAARWPAGPDPIAIRS